MKVSVIMPVHNGLPFLDEALSSILTQTFKELIVIAVDDGSTDDSLKYLRQIADPRLQVIALNTCGGAGHARNLGIEMSKSEYIAFMDADDISLPERLERQVKYLDHNPDIGAVGTMASYFTHSGQTGFVPQIASDHNSIRGDLMAGRHAIINATLMIRAEVLKLLNGFKVLGNGDDTDFHLRLTEATRVANLNEVLYLYRLNSQSSNLLCRPIIHLRKEHALVCARCRAANQGEISFEDFSAQWHRQPSWVHWLDLLDQKSAIHYRKAMAEILNKDLCRGYLRFLIASLLSPQRVFQRIERIFRNMHRSH